MDFSTNENTKDFFEKIVEAKGDERNDDFFDAIGLDAQSWKMEVIW